MQEKVIRFPYQPLPLPPTYSSLPSTFPHYKAKSGKPLTGMKSDCVALDYVYHLNCCEFIELQFTCRTFY